MALLFVDEVKLFFFFTFVCWYEISWFGSILLFSGVSVSLAVLVFCHLPISLKLLFV